MAKFLSIFDTTNQLIRIVKITNEKGDLSRYVEYSEKAIISLSLATYCKKKYSKIYTRLT